METILWQKITPLASEILFDVNEHAQSKIIVAFDFTKAAEILYRQFQKNLLS